MQLGEKAVVMHRINRVWPRNAEFQFHTFSGAALYWQSMADLEKSKESGRNFGDHVQVMLRLKKF